MIVAITSLDFIWNFNSFGLVYVLTDGGPGGKTMLPMLFAYDEAFRYGNYGYAAAMGNVMVDHRRRAPVVYLRRQLRELPSDRVTAPARSPGRCSTWPCSDTWSSSASRCSGCSSTAFKPPRELVAR